MALLTPLPEPVQDSTITAVLMMYGSPMLLVIVLVATLFTFISFIYGMVELEGGLFKALYGISLALLFAYLCLNIGGYAALLAVSKAYPAVGKGLDMMGEDTIRGILVGKK